MGARLELTGRKFGSLTVISLHPKRGNDGTCLWKCICKCGRESLPTGRNLVRGLSTSCGLCDRPLRTLRHGHSAGGKTTKTYWVWHSMKDRCFNQNNKRFKDYGGRGITVCERWLTFDNFLSDMGEKPNGLTIERVNNSGNYEPGNCQWDTHRQQTRNRRNTIRITRNGQLVPLASVAEELGIPYRVALWRFANR